MSRTLLSRPRDAAPLCQTGLSLIELMISITLGLIILAAVTTLFVGQSKTRTDLEKANRLIENGRYALEVLSENLRLAGFYAELDPSSAALPATLPDPCATTAVELTAAVRLHVQGYNAAGIAAAIPVVPGPPASPPCGLVSNTNLKTGSDVLVLRRAGTDTAVLQANAVAGTPYLQASLCPYDSSAYKVDITPANFTLRQRTCTTTSTTPYADLRPYMVHVYFVSPDNVSGDGIPTLKRMELTSAGSFSTVALVEGIEYLQMDYGIDSSGDGVVDSWSNCAACTTTDWSNVVTVKINVLARNLDTTSAYSDAKTYALGLDGSAGPLGDAYKRHAYSQIVRLVNPAGRRETP